MSEEETTAAEQAVARYHEAKEALDEFLGDPDIRDVLDELHHLVREHNQLLDSATRTVKGDLRASDRTRLVVNGIGAQKKMKRWYDVNHLAEALPASQSDLILTEKIVYELDKEILGQMLRQGEIDNEIVEQSYHEEEQQPSNLPGTPKPFELPPLPVTDE